MTRRGLTAALAALCALGWASSAQAFTLDGARVQAQVGPDGSVLVREQITISGAFHGAYRDIPVAPGQVVDNVVVSEDGRPYGLGGSTELGSIGQPDQYATTRSGDDLRVVWHFDDPGGDPRTFTVEYRFRGLTVAYSDVVDLNYRVWGDQWSASLPRLDAVVVLPGRAEGSAYRAWAGPGWVPGYVTRGSDRVTLVAGPVPAHQFVDLRVTFPRDLLRATTGAQERSGPGLSRIESEVAASIHQAEDGRRHLREWKARWPLTVVLLLLLGLGPGLAVVAYVYWRLGREPRVDYDREYEQEPPSDLAPALVPPLVREQTGVGPAEFTATLFDLIRRGAYKATQVTTEESHWAGLSKHSVADLEVQAGDKRNDLTDFESAVVEIVDGVVGDSGERLSRFRARIEERRQENAELFADFKSQVSDEIRTRQWYRDTGRLVLGAALALFGVAGALLLFAGVQGLEPELLWSKILMITFGACLVTSSLVCGAGFLRTPLWRQRTAEAELEARRWDAFRRYLTDFPRLGEAAPATLVLWERYLVYGIAFGIAERVLQAAHLQMPEALHDQSSIFWISGAYGAGPSQLGIGDLSAGFGSALAPPSGSSGSGAGGFGGSFGGGGFGGGGGGGGGGW